MGKKGCFHLLFFKRSIDTKGLFVNNLKHGPCYFMMRK